MDTKCFNVRGVPINIPNLVIEQIPLLDILVSKLSEHVTDAKEDHKISQEETILDSMSPNFLKYLVEFVRNEQKITYLQTVLENEFEKSLIKEWLTDLKMDYLVKKMYESNLPEVITVPYLTNEQMDSPTSSRRNSMIHSRNSSPHSRNSSHGKNNSIITDTGTRQVVIKVETVTINNISKPALCIPGNKYVTKGLKMQDVVHLVDATPISVNSVNFYRVSCPEHSIPNFNIPELFKRIIEVNGYYFMRMEHYITYKFNDVNDIKRVLGTK